MAKNPWRWIDNTTQIRMNPKAADGIDCRVIDHNYGKSIASVKRLRSDTKGKLSKLETKQGGLHLKGCMPESGYLEMSDECGYDPEKRRMWLREHPEHLTTTPTEAGLPQKRLFFGPLGDAWGRINWKQETP